METALRYFAGHPEEIRGLMGLYVDTLQEDWDRVATFEHLCAKAALSRHAWNRADAEFLVYQTQTFRE